MQESEADADGVRGAVRWRRTAPVTLVICSEKSNFMLSIGMSQPACPTCSRSIFASAGKSHLGKRRSVTWPFPRRLCRATPLLREDGELWTSINRNPRDHTEADSLGQNNRLPSVHDSKHICPVISNQRACNANIAANMPLAIRTLSLSS